MTEKRLVLREPLDLVSDFNEVLDYQKEQTLKAFSNARAHHDIFNSAADYERWWREQMGEYDNDNDYWDDLFYEGGKRRGKKKKNNIRRRGKKKKKPFTPTFFIGDEEVDEDTFLDHNSIYGGEDDPMNEKKKIIFYHRLNDEFDILEFETLCDFDEWCLENNVHVSASSGEDCLYYDEVHCCFDPLEEGLVLVVSDSYENLVYHLTYGDAELIDYYSEVVPKI